MAKYMLWPGPKISKTRKLNLTSTTIVDQFSKRSLENVLLMQCYFIYFLLTYSSTTRADCGTSTALSGFWGH